MLHVELTASAFRLRFLMLIIAFIDLLVSAKDSRSAQMGFSETQPHFGNAYVGIPLEIDSVNGSEFRRVMYKCGPVRFEIVKDDSLLVYTPYLFYKGLVPIADSKRFKQMSVRKWNRDSAPVFSLRYNNEQGKADNIYWSPATIAKYYDERLNEFPIEVTNICKYLSDIENESLEIYAKQFETVEGIKTPRHKIGVRDGVHYKDIYIIGDTIPLSDCRIKIDSVDFVANIIHYEKLSLEKTYPTLPVQLMRLLDDGLNSDGLYLIEFYGSWCSPCIEGLKKLLVHKTTISKLSNLLTIACEDNEADYQKSKQLLDSLGVDWNVNFELINSGYNKILNISSFPTYILASGSGIIYLQTNDADEVLKYIDNFGELVLY